MTSAELLGPLVDSAAAVADREDPLEAEALGATFVALATAGGDEMLPASTTARTSRLGLDDASEFDPAAFDDEEINPALAKRQ